MGKYATKEQLTALVADMASKINIASGTQGVSGSYVPIGCIEAFMGVEAPPDFLVCDGSLHSIASYPQLADHFYEQFGASNHFGGNGTTTFAVPDLRGEFLRGTGTNSHTGNGDGENVGDHQDATSQPLVKSVGDFLIAYHGDSDNVVTNPDTEYGSSEKITFGNQKNTDVGQPFAYTARPTNTSVLWCIKAIDEKFNPKGMVDYSTDEQNTGLKWIDGKDIYQKTYELLNIPANTVTRIDISEYFDVFFKKGVFGIRSDNTTKDSDYVIDSTDKLSILIQKSNGQSYFLVSSKATYSKIYVTVQYTKTS